MTDPVTEARALLMQPLLRAVSRLMPARAMQELRADLAALRDASAKQRTPQAAAMVEACDMALADLLPDMAHRSGDDGR